MDGLDIGAGFLDPELPFKFEKIKESLTKEKSKVIYLKNALSEEHTKTRQQDQKITEQNQRMRQFGFEQDSLLFRNSQLSKRVEILQEDIQTILTNATTTATKKIKRPSTPQLSLSTSVSRSSSTTSLPNSIAHDGTSLEAFAADLSNKITENERLHNEIFEQTSQNRTQKIEFEEIICELKRDYKSLSKEHSEQKTQFQTSMEELESRNIVLCTQIEQKSEENRSLTQELTELKENLYKLECKFKNDTQQHLQLVRDKLPFIDDEFSEFNNYNLPPFDNTLHTNFILVFKQISNLFIAFCSQTSLLHSYIESSIKSIEHDPDSNLKVIQAKFISKLHRTKFYSKPIENYLILITQSIESSEFLLECDTFKELYGNLAQFVKYVRIIAKYHTLYLREESRDIKFTLELKKCHQQLRNLIETYPISLEKLLNIILILKQAVSLENYPRLIENIQVNLLQLCVNTKDLSLCFTNKFKLEEQSQLQAVDESARSDNQCIMTSLAGIMNTTDKLMRCFTEGLPVITAYGKLALKSQSDSGTNSGTKLLREKARNYMEALNVHSTESLLYPVSLSLANQVFSYIPEKNSELITAQPRDLLLVQLQTAHNSLALVEREKENLTIELQLLKLQQQRVVKQQNLVFNNTNDEFEKSVTNMDSQLIDFSDSSSLHDSSVETVSTINNDLVEILQPSLTGDSNTSIDDVPQYGGDRDREKIIRDYYTNRITQLTEQLQSSDCKTTFYYNEIKSISKHITHLQQLRKRDLHQIEDSTNKLQQLEADLDTTQKGYEHQLNVMSETMLSLNEQLSQRQDEVERLSSDISTKKKTKKNT